MRKEAYASLDELLAPETLTRLLESPIASVKLTPFAGGLSASGSAFLTVATNDGRGPRLVLKQGSPACDWIARATGDERGREVVAWETGFLDRLPREVSHPILACARDESGWAILMRDVSSALIPVEDPCVGPSISAADHALILDALTALHATFWQEPDAADPALGFCSPWHQCTAFSPATGEREADHPNQIARWISAGWYILWDTLDRNLADLLQRLVADPTPLCAAMARYPQTVVHADVWLGNLGIERRNRSPCLVLLDWHLVGPSVPGTDLARFIGDSGMRQPVSRETTIAWYRDRLARRLGPLFDDAWWQPQLELSLLGNLVRMGWLTAQLSVQHEREDVREWLRQDLKWWSERALAATRWL